MRNGSASPSEVRTRSGEMRELPRPIVDALRQVIRRLRRIILLRGVAALAAVTIGSILVVMAIDASVVIFSQVSRWLLTLTIFGAAIAVAVWFLARPLAKTLTLAGIARAIEEHHPELQERLSSAVELLTSHDLPEMRGSEVLIAALAREAVQDARTVRPRREVSFRPARPYVLAAAAVFAVLGGLFVIWPKQTSHLLARAVAPYLNLPNVSAWELEIEPGGKLVGEGQTVEVKVRTANRAVTRASIQRVEADGKEKTDRMTPLSDEDGKHRFVFNVPPAQKSYRYRIYAGDALSEFFTITVEPLPVVKRLEVQYDYPAYTGLKPRVDPESSGALRAVVGTTIALTAVTNKPVASAAFEVDGRSLPVGPPTLAPAKEGGTAVTFRVPLQEPFKARWSIQMTDAHGFSGSTPDYTIEALPDVPPTVKVIRPDEKKIRLKPSDRLPIHYAMSDDFGLAEGQILLEVDGRRRPPLAVSLEAGTAAEAKSLAGDTLLALGALDLRGAKQVSFRLRAVDNRPERPQEGVSERYTIELDWSAESYARQVELAHEKQIRDALEKVLQELKTAKKDTAWLKERLPKIEALDQDANRKTDRAVQHLGVAHAGVRAVREMVVGGPFENLGPKLQEVDETHINQAELNLGLVKLSEVRAERDKASETADARVDRAIQLVEEMLKEFERMAEAVRLAQQLADLANREDQLAAERAAMDQQAQDKAAQDQWQNAQADVRNDLGQMLKEMPGAVRSQLSQDAQVARSMAQEAARLQKEQQALAQETERVGQLDRVDDALKQLAEEENRLAQEAASSPATSTQAEPMKGAAENILSNQLPNAVQAQRGAEKGLAQEAKDLRQEQAAAQSLADQARNLANQAQQLANQAQQAQQQTAGAQNPEQAAQGQRQMADVAKAEQVLAREEAKLAQQAQAQGAPEAAQAAFQQHDAAGAMEKAAGQMQQAAKASAQPPQGGQQGQSPAAQQAPKGAQAAQQAAQAAQELANALNQAAQQAAQAAQQGAPQADQLAQRQADLRRRTEELMNQRNQIGAPLQQAQMSRIQAEQAQVAREAAQLSQQVASAAPPSSPLAAEAAIDAQTASQQANASRMAEAAQNAGEAGQELGQLAQNLSGQAAQMAAGQPESGQGQPESGQGQPESGQGQPESGQGRPESGQGQPESGQGQPESGQGQPESGQGQPESGQSAQRMAALAGQAVDLAQRQQALAAEMAALAERQPAQVAQAAQQGLAAQTQDLRQAVGQLAQQASQLAPQSGAPQQAQEAANHLGQASQAQAQAESALGSPSPANALGPEQQAASELGQAASALAQMGQALAQAAGQAPSASPETMGPSQAMAEAYGAASEATQSPSAANAAAAAEAMRAAAGQAAAMAQGRGAEPGHMGMAQGQMPGQQPSQTANSQKGIGMVAVDETEAKLKEMGITLADWARLPGELRDQVLQAADAGAPEEYRNLIKRYFQAIAKRGSQNPAEGGK